MSYILCDIDDRDIATITLNRPELHNAFNDKLVIELTEVLEKLDRNPSVRAVIITGAGHSFSAGTDLEWKERCFNHPESENTKMAGIFAKLLKTLDNLSKPTIAKVNGNVYGSAIGLIACCDIAISTSYAKYALTEVKLGIIPAIIGQYVIRAMGERNARRYIITSTQFSGHRAKEIGLIHEIANDAEALEDAIEVEISHLLSAGQEAVKQSKELIHYWREYHYFDTPDTIEHTAKLFASVHASEEAHTRLNHFLIK